MSKALIDSVSFTGIYVLLVILYTILTFKSVRNTIAHFKTTNGKSDLWVIIKCSSAVWLIIVLAAYLKNTIY